MVVAVKGGSGLLAAVSPRIVSFHRGAATPGCAGTAVAWRVLTFLAVQCLGRRRPHRQPCPRPRHRCSLTAPSCGLWFARLAAIAGGADADGGVWAGRCTTSPARPGTWARRPAAVPARGAAGAAWAPATSSTVSTAPASSPVCMAVQVMVALLLCGGSLGGWAGRDAAAAGISVVLGCGARLPDAGPAGADCRRWCRRRCCRARWPSARPACRAPSSPGRRWAGFIYAAGARCGLRRLRRAVRLARRRCA